MLNKSIGELSGKFCSKLGCDVLVYHTADENGNETGRCLSSHLCRSDERRICSSSDYATKKEKNENINQEVNYGIQIH